MPLPVLTFYMVTKVFTDKDGSEMTAFLNTNNQCFIEINNSGLSSGDISSSSFIVLDMNDLSELIKELQSIKRSL